MDAILLLVILGLVVYLAFQKATKIEHEDGNTYWSLNGKNDRWGIVFRKRS